MSALLRCFQARLQMFVCTMFTRMLSHKHMAAAECLECGLQASSRGDMRVRPCVSQLPCPSPNSFSIVRPAPPVSATDHLKMELHKCFDAMLCDVQSSSARTWSLGSRAAPSQQVGPPPVKVFSVPCIRIADVHSSSRFDGDTSTLTCRGRHHRHCYPRHCRRWRCGVEEERGLKLGQVLQPRSQVRVTTDCTCVHLCRDWSKF